MTNALIFHDLKAPHNIETVGLKSFVTSKTLFPVNAHIRTGWHFQTCIFKINAIEDGKMVCESVPMERAEEMKLLTALRNGTTLNYIFHFTN